MNSLTPQSALPIGPYLLMICVMPLVLVGCGQDASPGSNPPVVDAGGDQTVDAGAVVTLDGSASTDPDGDPLSFRWKQKLGTQVTLSSTTAAVVSFNAPSIGAALAFELKVSDGQNDPVAQTFVSVRPVDHSAGQIIERAQPSIHDDPAVRGDFPDSWTAPGPPPGPSAPPGKGANQLIGETDFAPLVEMELSPGAAHEVELQVAVPSVLNASVRWIGTHDALDVRLIFNGAPLATGKSYRFAKDRGGSFVSAETTVGGRTVLSVSNTAAVAVRVRILLGASAL